MTTYISTHSVTNPNNTLQHYFPHRSYMELAKCPGPAIVLLLKACSLLVFLGYATSVSGQVESVCPLIAPLSSYSPSVSSVCFSPVTSEVVAQLESKVSTFLATYANSIPFYAVSVVHEDQTVFTSGQATAPFMIASITKTFTALGALILRERGLLYLDEPVKKFLPNFTIINPYESHDITLRELMGHVSGMPRELCDSFIVTGQSEEKCPIEEADVLKTLALMQLIRPPWSREPAYSNLGFALLGHSWEKATSPSMCWGEFVVEEILKPLGMSSSGVRLTNITLVTDESAELYDVGWQGPAAGMYSTATDLAKYLIFLLNAEPGLISGATIREWTTSRTIFPDGNGGFALPWEVFPINSTGGEFLITKGGVITGDRGTFESVIAIHPPTQLGISILDFVDNDYTAPNPIALAQNMLNYLIPLVENETSAIIDPLYTGHYVCNASSTFSEPLNATVEVFGGFIDITDSPSHGLSAFANVSVQYGGRPRTQLGAFGMLLKNSTENSFWLSVIPYAGCSGYFLGLSAEPSQTDPNYPGTDYMFEIAFDFAKKTVVWPSYGAVCTKT